MEETQSQPLDESAKSPAASMVPPQTEGAEAEKEIDLNLLFPDAAEDLNALFPETDLRELLKKISKNKKDLGFMVNRIAEMPEASPEPQE